MTKESNIMAGNDLQADVTAVAEFMGHICEGWEALAEHNPLIEIRCIGASRNVTVATTFCWAQAISNRETKSRVSLLNWPVRKPRRAV